MGQVKTFILKKDIILFR